MHPQAGSVLAEGEGVPGATVVFTSVLGDVRFTSGGLALDGKQATVVTDDDGRATVKFIAGQPGLSIIQASLGATSVKISVNATSQ